MTMIVYITFSRLAEAEQSGGNDGPIKSFFPLSSFRLFFDFSFPSNLFEFDFFVNLCTSTLDPSLYVFGLPFNVDELFICS